MVGAVSAVVPRSAPCQIPGNTCRTLRGHHVFSSISSHIKQDCCAPRFRGSFDLSDPKGFQKCQDTLAQFFREGFVEQESHVVTTGTPLEQVSPLKGNLKGVGRAIELRVAPERVHDMVGCAESFGAVCALSELIARYHSRFGKLFLHPLDDRVRVEDSITWMFVDIEF